VPPSWLSRLYVQLPVSITADFGCRINIRRAEFSHAAKLSPILPDFSERYYHYVSDQLRHGIDSFLVLAGLAEHHFMDAESPIFRRNDSVVVFPVCPRNYFKFSAFTIDVFCPNFCISGSSNTD